MRSPVKLLRENWYAWRNLSKSRPDLGVAQLQRQIAVLERLCFDPEETPAAVSTFAASLKPAKYSGELIRIGSSDDGGYLLPENLLETAKGVLSIGVGGNNDADVVLAEYGLNIHAWDHTVSGLPRNHPNITFHPVGLGNQEMNNRLVGLESMLDTSFPKLNQDLILLIDVEGAEWDALESTPLKVLERFSVISIELHGCGEILHSPARVQGVLEKLNTVFVPICVSSNNYGASWSLGHEKRFPDVIEVTYVSRGKFEVSDASIGTLDNTRNTSLLSDINISWLFEEVQ